MQVEASSTLRQDDSILIPVELIIVPNLKIQAIINDESLMREAKVPPAVNPVAGDLASSEEEPSCGRRLKAS
nr:hypothetical protein CFP56_61188 [Quercus suber]